MANQHDRIIKDLIANREFAVSFLKQYLPKELITMIDWESVKLDSANVEHSRQEHKDNLKQKEQSDLAFLFKFKDGKQGAVFTHIEAQTTDDITLILRVRHYQTSFLLDFIKRNNDVKKLPLIVSIIYYANKKPFTYSLDINDYFENVELAKKYAFNTQFVDLNRMSDEEIINHGFISAYELVLKYIREKKIDGKLDIVAKQMIDCDSIYRQILIKYIYYNSALEPDLFYNRIIESQPTLEGDIMTTAEQLKQRSFKQGIERGGLEAKKETAKNLIKMGIEDEKIIVATGLTTSVIDALKTQH